MEVIADHIKAPDCVVLKDSLVDSSRIGAFSKTRIAKDTEFGPYHGKIIFNKNDERVDPKYSWEVFDLETFKFLHIVDATDTASGNWMRHVCCARFFEEQNIVSTQHGEEVFYKALKDIEVGEELLTWFQPKKKKRKRSSVGLSSDSQSYDADALSESVFCNGKSAPASPEKGKRKRKPKIIPDSYHGPLEPESKKCKQAYDDMFEPLQPGQKRRRRKKLSIDSRNSSSSALDLEFSEKSDMLQEESNDIDNPDDESRDESIVSTATSSKEGKEVKKENCQAMSISEINNSVDWQYPAKGEEYLFELRGDHVTIRNGKKVFKCDICMGLYKHMFSLKRHYLRNHVNYRYLSKADMTNCLINLAQVIQNMKERGLDVNSKSPNKCKNHGCESEIKSETPDTNRDNDKSAVADDSDNKAIPSDKDSSDDQESQNSSKTVDEEDSKGTVDDCEANCNENIGSVESSAPSEELVNGVNSEDSELVNYFEHGKTENSVNKGDETKEIKGEIQHGKFDKTVTKSDENQGIKGEIPKNSNDPDTTMNNEERLNTEEKVMTLKSGETLRSMLGLFRCYTCYDVFDTVEDVRDHVQNHPFQEEGTCFSCNQCNMRFNYKQNLVRHKKVHENEVISDNGDISETGDRLTDRADVAPLTSSTNGPAAVAPVRDSAPMVLPPGVAHHPHQPETYQVFKCSKCKTKFESLEEMTDHVKAEHVSGNKFQCQYCGKDFPSMPNMKKHVRFHLGYRVSCRFCPDVFPNVGALRKHIRLSHPDIYKAKLLDKLDAADAARKLAKSGNSETKVNGNPESAIELTNESKPKLTLTNPKNSKQEDFAYDHEISFAADEIDDGGSRFKFSCTVCKKRFSNYINMCRHRRKSHSNDSKPRHEELSLSFRHKPKNAISPVQEDPVEVAQFFANVSHNIATNLNCFIDGQSQALEKFVDHIKIDNYSGNFGYNPVETGPYDLTWSDYNFPPNYRPAETVGVVTEDLVETPAVSETQNKVTESPVQESNKPCETVSDNSENRDTSVNSDQDPEEMGLKMLSGLSNSQKQINTMENKAGNRFFKLRIEGGAIACSSPEAKKFIHVEKGEYANFDDDLEPSDINDVEMPRSRQNSKSSQRRWAPGKDGRTGPSSSSIDGLGNRRKDVEATRRDELLEAAQAELEDLYDSIEGNEHDGGETKTSLMKQTPDMLSVLCENLLGIKKSVKGGRSNKHKVVETEDVEDCNSETFLLSELNLASQRAASMKMTNGVKTVVPDYSDVPNGSPFYNYESIAFGSSGQVISVCAICRRHFKDIEGVLRHHWKKHPGSVFQILEVEQGNEIDTLHFVEPSYVGALAVTDPGLGNMNSVETFSCTKCGSMFRSVSRLHVHIVSCSPIDPVYGSSKVEKSPSKISFSKKIQKKIHSILGKDPDIKPNALALKNVVAGPESKSQKRVFTGCRKRKSIILPDSPVKAGLLPRDLLDLRAGYNPDRHIRRRELTELVDTLTCEACGLKFKTIILLERHVKNCTKKEKFKNVHPLACPIMDESLARIKNICFYCEKNFTYTKSLINHFQDFCPVKKARVDKGLLTDDDKQKEDEIVERVKRLDEEKVIRDTDHVIKKITWQVGRKPKRKGHAWTYIKKKKQLEGEENDLDKDSVVTDEDDIGSDKETDKEAEIAEELIEKSVPDSTTTVSDEGNADESIASDQTCKSFDEVDSASEVSEQQAAVFEQQMADDDSNAVKSEDESVDKEETIKGREDRQSLEPVGETHVNNMSLNCTARYRVNQIIRVEDKSKAVGETALKSSFMFQCVTKAADESEVIVKSNKKTVQAEQKKLVQAEQKKLEETNSLIVGSKRKRERVGRVEEFLRNAFRRRRTNKKSQQTSVPTSTENENGGENKETQEYTALMNKQEPINAVAHIVDNQHDHESLDTSETSSLVRSQTKTTNVSSDPPAIEKPRKRGRPRKESSDTKKPQDKPVGLRKGGPGRPPSISVPGKRGRPPKFKVKTDLPSAEILEAENQKSAVSNTETEDLRETKLTCDTVSSAIVDDAEQSDNKLEEPLSGKGSILIPDIQESDGSLTEEKTEENKLACDSCDTDNDSHTETSVPDNEEILENHLEGNNQNNKDTVEVQQNNASSKGNHELDETVIDSKSYTSYNEPKEKTTEVVEEQVKMQDENTDIMNIETSGVNTDEISVKKLIEYDSLDISAEVKLDNSENDKHVEINLLEHNENSKTFEEIPISVKENMVENQNKVDVKDVIIEQEQTMDMKIEVPVNNALENEGELLQDEALPLINDESTVPEKSDIASDKDEMFNTDSVNSECDSDSQSKALGTEDEHQKERASSTDTTERSVSTDMSESEGHDSAIPKSPDPLRPERYEMVLSPSERVKMNKRSCMKGRDVYTPVWVRKPHKPKLKSPERKVTDDSVTSNNNNKVSETTKHPVETVTKPGSGKDQPVVTQCPTDKKPVFRNRQEAINENLKLLHKQASMKFAENMKAKNAVISSDTLLANTPASGVLANKVSEEKLRSDQEVKKLQPRGIKRKAADTEAKGGIDSIPLKKKPASSKSEKSDIAIGGSHVCAKEELKDKDKKVNKQKGVKR